MMPLRDTEARRAYDRQRNADPERKARVNARRRQRYAEDPAVRARTRAYADNYRDGNRLQLNALDRQRNQDPERRARVNARRRQRYASDPEFRASYLAYQLAYRTQGPVNLLTRSGRIARGMIWTPEEEQAHLGTAHCAVCGNEPPPSRGIFADHCHRCRHYRGALCPGCNHALGIIEKWLAVCPEGSPMKTYMDRHTCQGELRCELARRHPQNQLPGAG